MIILEDVVKVYEGPRGPVKALDGVSLHVREGEFLVVSGPSGSGKSTLLMIMAAMLRASSGKVTVNDNELNQMGNRELEELRARKIGFVFQMFHLIPYLNVLENVLMAARKSTGTAMVRKAEELLAGLEMQDRIDHKPSELSTGERQRVAIARALLNDPVLFLADEPTGNLDPDNAGSVLRYFSDLNSRGCTVVLATHQIEAGRFADRLVFLEKGRLHSGRQTGILNSAGS